MMFVLNKFIFILTFSLIDPHIYLYHTQDGFDLEFYDCVLFQSLYYCRRPTSPINLTRDHHSESCQINGGQLYRFSELKDRHINTSTILHGWKSSIERVEQYSRYLTHPTVDKDGHICQCIDSASFGKNCEYQLPVGDTLQETLDWQLITRQKNPNQVQMHVDFICHTTLTCSFAPLCLDWREICDGIQNCQGTEDETNCDFLEMNVCDDDDEYRCMNGMCIPHEYFLDGEFDCLDWSDELQYKKSEECARESVSMRCDDHVCPPNEWPCGDGQCIRDRLAFDTVKGSVTCENRRDQYFICEETRYPFSWTMSNGRCHEGTPYEAPVITNRTQEEYCEYLVRCVLSRGIEINCPCPNGPSCKNEIRQYCSNQLVTYPRRPFITSFIYRFYRFIPTSEGYSLEFYYRIFGIVRCQRSFIVIIKPDLIYPLENAARTVHDYACRKAFSNSDEEIPITAHECHHQNESTNICDEWNPCMSITRLRDGFINCLNYQDESEEDDNIDVVKNCSRVQRYRFRCSTQQSMCLSVMALGNEKSDCKNEFDESWFGTGRPLSQMHCNDQRKDQCSHLRRYIEQSWSKTSDLEQLSLTNRIIPFRSYCDTFWNLDPSDDENRTTCKQSWVCASDQQECHTKQCFDQSWKMDGEWDCPGAKDESTLLHDMSKHVYQRTESTNASDSHSHFATSTCNQTNQFLCLSPFTSYLQFHCIHQDRIADGQIDCAGAIDEQNIVKHCSQSQPLGFHYLCLSTNTCIPYFHHCRPGYRCPNRTDDESWCSFLDRSANCPNVNYFRCLDGICRQTGRCDGGLDCLYLEDEYMCDRASTTRRKLIPFRSEKQSWMRNKRKYFRLPQFPHDTLASQSTTANNAFTQFPSTSTTNLNHPSSSANLTAYRCNRGIGVLSTDNQTICFCPPQYYGDRCQYHNDRLSVLLHLNLSQSIYRTTTDSNVTLKLLLIFFDHNQTLMTHEFHVRPAFEDTINEKKRVHFFYSHASDNRQRRENRYHNRSDILHHHPYSIQIDLYELRPNENPVLVSVWKYSLFFDYLPVSHFAKVLHLRPVNATENPCSSDPCPVKAACYPLMNDHSQHVCVCKANYSGENCLKEDQECRDGHCVEGSLCQSSYRAAHRGSHHPYCVCPFGRFGDQCDVELDSCNPNPCQNGGSCLFSSKPDQATCLCTMEYYGDKCQLRKRHIRLSVDTSVRHSAVVIQYFDIDFVSLDLYFVHQQVYTSIPHRIEYYYIQPNAPNIVLAKLYSSHEDMTPQSYLLSLSTNIASIEAKTVISDFSRCQHVHQRFKGILFSSRTLISVTSSFFFKDLSPIRYHSLCRNDTTLLCFRDDHYLCICVDNHTRVECFIYDQQLDRCSKCLHNGRCLQGDPTRSTDFVCLCPLCYSGGQCQFSSKSFSFTLDQLFYTDLVFSHRSRTVAILLIFFSVLAFILAIPNNLFSFVTFNQKPCLRNGVGHYLLTLSVISQLNLALFVARLSHLSLNIVHQSSSLSINTILCKLFNYFLVSSSRMVYWFSSLIAIERVYMSVVLNGQWLKQPRIARRLILITIFTTLISTVYECVFFRSLSINDITQRSMCIFEFPHAHRSQWMIVHLFVSTLHSVVPFIINLCSTITIGIMVVKKKMNTRRAEKSRKMTCIGRIRFILSVLNENRELVIGPGLTLIPQLFSLPLFISSFTLDCQNIENSWVRYLLITLYWTSFTPQIISFFLYISPSSFYSDEWHKTKLRQRIISLLRWR